MIAWLSEHDETTPTGEVRRFRIGKPSDAFWADYDANPVTWTERGYEVFPTTSGRFIKMATGTLVEPPCAGAPMPSSFASFLRDFQKPHVENLWRTFSIQTAAGDFSDTGTGKTFTTLALALELERPLFVVCKLAGMAKWQKLSQRYGVKILGVGNYEYFKGDNDFGAMQVGYYPVKVWAVLSKMYEKNFPPPFPKQKVFEDFKACMDYFFSKTIFRPKHCQEFEDKSGKSLRLVSREIRGYKWNLPKNTLFVFDEAHKCKSEDSQNMRLLVAAKEYPTMALTATPGITPRDFKAMGYVLGLHRLYDFDLWTETHGCRRVYTRGKTRKFIGWDYAKKSGGIETLNRELFPLRASRMRIADIPDFPKTSITAEAFTAVESEKVREAYGKCVQACKAQIADRTMLQVTAILRYRMFAEKMKVPLFISLIDEAIEGGFSVAVFVNFKETLRLLQEHYPGTPMIFGRQKMQVREAARQAFEDNKVDKIFLNMEAGGDSLDLHDIHGGHPRMSLIAPTYNPYTLKQVFGRLQRDGALTPSIQRIVYMAGTQEEQVCENVREKLQAFATINGDELTPDDLIETEFKSLSNVDFSNITEEEDEADAISDP